MSAPEGSTFSELPRSSVDDEAGMWVDLWDAHLNAESARVRVTRRAELYLRAAGLPLERVLEALGTDEAGWADRVTQLRAREQANRAAADRYQAWRRSPTADQSCEGSTS